MKKLITPIILLLLLSGCSKNPISPTDEENSDGEQLLEFTIDGFSQQLLPFADQIKALSIQASANRTISSGSLKAETVPGSMLRDHVNAIDIKIFHKMVMVDSVRQYSDDPKFGTYSKYLPNNSNNIYHIFIAAAKLENEGDFEMRLGKNGGGGYTDGYVKIHPDPTDAFFIYQQLNLANTPKPQNLKLKRFVGRLEINLKDSIPAGTDHIEVSIENTAQYFLMMDQRGYRHEKDIALDSIPYQTVKVINIKPEDLGKENFSFDAYFVKNGLLTDGAETTTVTLKAFDAEDNLLKSRSIPNVQIQANMRTKLSGYLFTVPNVNFDIEIVSAWNPDIPEYEF